MDLFINIALLTLGFIGAIMAIGGDTWDRNEPSLYKRITHRGWIAITCFILTFGLGIAKELRSAHAPPKEFQLTGKITSPSATRIKEGVEIELTAGPWVIRVPSTGKVNELVHPNLHTLWVKVVAPGYDTAVFTTTLDYANGEYSLGDIDIGKLVIVSDFSPHANLPPSQRQGP